MRRSNRNKFKKYISFRAKWIIFPASWADGNKAHVWNKNCRMRVGKWLLFYYPVLSLPNGEERGLTWCSISEWPGHSPSLIHDLPQDGWVDKVCWLLGSLMMTEKPTLLTLLEAETWSYSRTLRVKIILANVLRQRQMKGVRHKLLYWQVNIGNP